MAQATRRQKPSKASERGFKTKTCNIPSLTELRKSLGYGHRGEEQDIAFKRALTEQVETFVSSDNLPGVSLTKWKTLAHQKGLREMTKVFLLVKQKGPEFWPDDPNSPNRRPLQFSRDFEAIYHLLIKVFYRTAREYKRKQSTTSTPQESTQNPKSTSTKKPLSKKVSGEQTSRQTYPESRGQSADDPIELDSMQPTTNASGPSADVDPFAESSRRFAPEQFMPLEMPDGIPPDEEPINQVWEMRDDFLNIQADSPASNIPSHTAPVEDPYQGPNSPTEDTHVPRDRGKRPARDYSIQDVRPAKVPRQEQDNIEVVAGSSTSGSSSSNSSTNVASTSNSSSNFAPTSAPSQDAPPADPPSAAPVKKRGYARHEYKQTRSSGRARNPVRHPDFAREQTIDDALLTSSSEDEEQDNDREGGFREPPRPAVNVSNEASSRENPSSTAPRGNDTAPAAEQPSSKPGKKASKKQASTKKGSMLPPKAPVPQPRSRTRRVPVHESPAGPSTERNSTQQQANDSSTSGTGTRQPPTNHSQTSQPHMNEPRTEQNQPPPNNTVLSAEESQIIHASSFIFFRYGDIGFRSWRPTANVFQMTLSELMLDLGWTGANVRPLCVTLETPFGPWTYDVEPGNNDQFIDGLHSFVQKMQRCYQQAKEPNLKFELHFSQQPV